MECEKCGTEYPSKYYFEKEGKLPRLICTVCYKSLSMEDLEHFLSTPRSKASISEGSQQIRSARESPAGLERIIKWGVILGLLMAIPVSIKYRSLYRHASESGLNGSLCSICVFPPKPAVKSHSYTSGRRVFSLYFCSTCEPKPIYRNGEADPIPVGPFQPKTVAVVWFLAPIAYAFLSMVLEAMSQGMGFLAALLIPPVGLALSIAILAA